MLLTKLSFWRVRLQAAGVLLMFLSAAGVFGVLFVGEVGLRCTHILCGCTPYNHASTVQGMGKTLLSLYVVVILAVMALEILALVVLFQTVGKMDSGVISNIQRGYVDNWINATYMCVVRDDRFASVSTPSPSPSPSPSLYSLCAVAVLQRLLSVRQWQCPEQLFVLDDATRVNDVCGQLSLGAADVAALGCSFCISDWARNRAQCALLLGSHCDHFHDTAAVFQLPDSTRDLAEVQTDTAGCAVCADLASGGVGCRQLVLRHRCVRGSSAPPPLTSM
jgi:hypothetical protein